jgi:predicted phage gp36 major capsid-like protein
VEAPPRRAAGRLLTAAELEHVRDDLRRRVDELRRSDEEARDAYREARAEEERRRQEEALREAQRRPNRVWPHAGASTLGRAPGATRVAWTTPHGW